jgi:hypothetical protein
LELITKIIYSERLSTYNLASISLLVEEDPPEAENKMERAVKTLHGFL